MKNQIKILLVLSAISIGTLTCKGSINSGDAGTTPQDSVKTNRDMNTDTTGSQTNIVSDTERVNGKKVDTTNKR
ncbi:hypothetical protein ACFS5N_12355 [Mucilaginibacter ximonensis]|uniref:Uncharacterized protein n=1 Tax=Mucilaginibacter ximonensis TaxID=538021 RepID=A0ABW5YD48_9SPHI